MSEMLSIRQANVLVVGNILLMLLYRQLHPRMNNEKVVESFPCLFHVIVAETTRSRASPSK